MGIRSRIFFTVFGILFVGITLSYIVAERDLSSTLENQIVEELEKQASLSKVTIGQINSYKNPKFIQNAIRISPTGAIEIITWY